MSSPILTSWISLIWKPSTCIFEVQVEGGKKLHNFRLDHMTRLFWIYLKASKKKNLTTPSPSLWTVLVSLMCWEPLHVCKARWSQNAYKPHRPTPSCCADSLFDTVLIPCVLSDGKVEQAVSAFHPPPPGGGSHLFGVWWSACFRICINGKDIKYALFCGVPKMDGSAALWVHKYHLMFTWNSNLLISSIEPFNDMK